MHDAVRSRRNGLISGLTAASIWGGMYVVSKVVLDIIPPFTLVTLRLLLGILVLWLIVRSQGGTRFSPRQTLRLLAVGLVGYGISLGLQFTGTKLPTPNGALSPATPAFVLLFAAWILGERTLRRLLSLFLATLGVAVMILACALPRPFWGNSSGQLRLPGNLLRAFAWPLRRCCLPATMAFVVGSLFRSGLSSFDRWLGRDQPGGSQVYWVLSPRHWRCTCGTTPLPS
jgi:drug/metabolite transporter (DMT)-like permease